MEGVSDRERESNGRIVSVLPVVGLPNGKVGVFHISIRGFKRGQMVQYQKLCQDKTGDRKNLSAA